MTITSITPNATTNKVYGWLKTRAAIALVNGNATFATVLAAFMKEDGKTLVKEQKYLHEAVQGNPDANIIIGLEKVAGITVATMAQSDITVAVGATEQAAPTGHNDAELTYTTEDPEIATVSLTGLVTGVKAGTTKLIIEAAENADYHGQRVEATITVS